MHYHTDNSVRFSSPHYPHPSTAGCGYLPPREEEIQPVVYHSREVHHKALLSSDLE